MFCICLRPNTAGSVSQTLFVYVLSLCFCTDFLSDTPLNKVDLQFWRAPDEGELIPIPLAPGMVATVKILCEAKDTFQRERHEERRGGLLGGGSGFGRAMAIKRKFP